MKRIRKYIQCHYILFSFSVNFIFLFIPLFLDLIKYEVSDDFIMELIVSGVYATPSPYIMFMNPIIGQILCVLYKLYPFINWYLWFQLLVVYFSFSIIGICLLKKKTNQSFLFFWIFLSFFSLDMYQLLQFTKTATIGVIAGGFLFYEYLSNEVHHKCYLTFSIIFVIIGTIIREQCLFLGASLLFVENFIYVFNKKKEFKKILKKELKYILILTLFLMSLYGYNKLFLYTNTEYKEFIKFSNIRALIVDYPSPPYSSIEQELSEKGISENDYEVFRHWEFFDTDFYSIERIEYMYDSIQNDKYAETKSIKELLKELYNRNYWQYIGFWCCFLIFLVLCFYTPQAISGSVLLSCLGIFLLFYNLWNGRLVYRVELSIFLEVASSLMLLATFYMENPMKRNLDKCAFTFTLVICIVMKLFYSIPEHYKEGYDIMFNSWNNDLRKYSLVMDTSNFEDLKQLFNENLDATYYLTFQSFIQTYYLSFNIHDSPKIDGFENVIYLAGVDTNNPAKNNFLEKHNIDNIANDLLDKNTFLVSKSEPYRVLRFLQEHYSKDLVLNKIDEKNGYCVWEVKCLDNECIELH